MGLRYDEKPLGWIKPFGGLRQLKLCGLDNVRAEFALLVIICNPICLNTFFEHAMEMDICSHLIRGVPKGSQAGF